VKLDSLFLDEKNYSNKLFLFSVNQLFRQRNKKFLEHVLWKEKKFELQISFGFEAD